MNNNPFRQISRLNRKKTDPNKFIFTGEVEGDKTSMQLFSYNTNFIQEDPKVNAADLREFSSTDQIYWLNVYGLSDTETIAGLCKQQGIDNLVIQDLLDVDQRPKFQDFEHYGFLTIKSALPSQSQVVIEQISFVFAKEYLFSFQERKADYFDHIRYRLRENKGVIRQRGTDFLLYTMLEAILDNYFKALDHMGNETERLNLSSIQTDPPPSVLEEIEKNKVFVHFIKNAILPIREFLLAVERKNVSFIEEKNLKFYLEIKDLCLTLTDYCDTLTQAMESSINLYFSVQGHRANQVMKTLTVVATIFIPLTFIAGVYGMNFSHMPELHWKYGYTAIWGLMLLVFLGMMVYFKRKRWF